VKHAIAAGNVGNARSLVRRRKYPKKTCFETAENLFFSWQYTLWFDTTRYKWHLCNVSKKHYKNSVVFNNINT
jgi:hypothetical protein